MPEVKWRPLIDAKLLRARLRGVCRDRKQYNNPFMIFHESEWSLSDVTEYLTTTGNLPTPKVYPYPGETLTLLRAGVTRLC